MTFFTESLSENINVGVNTSDAKINSKGGFAVMNTPPNSNGPDVEIYGNPVPVRGCYVFVAWPGAFGCYSWLIEPRRLP